jgi:hypothetical protein
MTSPAATTVHVLDGSNVLGTGDASDVACGVRAGIMSGQEARERTRSSPNRLRPSTLRARTDGSTSSAWTTPMTSVRARTAARTAAGLETLTAEADPTPSVVATAATSAAVTTTLPKRRLVPSISAASSVRDVDRTVDQKPTTGTRAIRGVDGDAVTCEAAADGEGVDVTTAALGIAAVGSVAPGPPAVIGPDGVGVVAAGEPPEPTRKAMNDPPAIATVTTTSSVRRKEPGTSGMIGL